MKKRSYIIIALAIVLILGAICVEAFRNRPVEDSMPYMIMVDGQVYQANGSVQEIPEDAVEGQIAKVIPENEMPDDNQTANFGEVGRKYWTSGNKIYVQSNNEYEIFVPTEN